jgi:hypothetical protein
MTEKDLYISRSNIEGEGLHTHKSIKKGQRAFVLKGEKYKKINNSLDDVFSNPDWVGFSKNCWLDPRLPYKRLNHSCNPNIGIKGSVTFYALRDIKAGEEFTFDYSTSESDPRWFLNCACGSDVCRKKIRSIQFLDDDTYKRYLPYIPIGIQKMYNIKNK